MFVSCICHSYTQTSWIFLWKCTTGKFMVYFCSLFSGQNYYIYNYSLHWDMIIITLLVVIWINFFRVIYVGHYEIKVQPSFCDTFEYLNDNICQQYCISRYIDIMFYSCIIRSILKKWNLFFFHAPFKKKLSNYKIFINPFLNAMNKNMKKTLNASDI